MKKDFTPEKELLFLALGGSAVYVPHPLTWAHENGASPLGKPGFHELAHIGLLPELVKKLEETGI